MTKVVKEYKGILYSQNTWFPGIPRREIFKTCGSFPSRFLSRYDTGLRFCQDLHRNFDTTLFLPLINWCLIFVFIKQNANLRRVHKRGYNEDSHGGVHL